MRQILIQLNFVFLILALMGCEAFLQVTPTPDLSWQPADEVMAGICFEAAFDAAGQVFVLESAAELADFYDLADHSELCRRPVPRAAFDFSGGQVLAGLWSRGSGCKARHDIEAYERHEAARQVSLHLRFVTEGDCPYELVRPFWVSIPQAAGYDIHIEVQED